MAKQTFPPEFEIKIHRLPKGRLPEVTRSADIKQEHIDIWLEKSRHNRDYPRVQKYFAELTALFWRGQRPNSDDVRLFGE